MNWRAFLTRQFKIPTLERFGRWLFSWRSVRAALFTALALATVVVLFYVVENWRGRYAWKKYRTAAERRGASFDFKTFIPPPVPDGQNFAMTPLLVPLFDYEAGTHPIVWRNTNGWNRVWRIAAYRHNTWSSSPNVGDWTRGQRVDLAEWQRYYRNEPDAQTNSPGRSPRGVRGNSGRTNQPPQIPPEDTFPTAARRQSPSADVLLALTKFDAEMHEIELAARRPHSRFPIHYGDGYNTLLAHLAKLRSFATLFQLRATAELAMTNTDAAFADLQTVFRLADSLKGEPIAISESVRVAMCEQGLQTLWEGMGDHLWSETQLAEVQKQSATLDVEAEFIRVFKAASAVGHLNTEQILQDRRRYARSWDNALPGINGKELFELYLRFAPSGWLYQNELVQHRRLDGFVASLEKFGTTGVFAPIPYRPADQTKLYELLVDFPGGFWTNILNQIPLAHAHLNLAEVACALERFHLAHGAYPQTLGELAPQFIARLPNDFMDGQPLRYRRLDDHRFKLYSVALDLKDDGGTFPASADGATGDWVWEIR